ncbi:polyhydroxyalkanoate synthesis repressor PhaR [Acetobacteraceae bacterium H6797]|nr:polyhydroxyalkanoate synthesis repressor PhaR [Acetobacteraceae bacterium H6797]
MVEPMKQRVEQGNAEPAKPPVVVKKYANRRLYNTEASSYVTLEDLAEMVRQGRDFVVYDAKTGDDITRSVLTQIIVEEEAKGRSLLPTSFLRQLIGFYGDSLQSVLPRYLEFAMGSFARQQEQMRVTMEGLLPFGGLEEVGKQNLAMMERAMSLFAPFPQSGAARAPEPAPERAAEDELEAVKAELEEMKRQMAALRSQGKGPKAV